MEDRAHSQRGRSFPDFEVRYPPAEIIRLSKELHDETIADVNLGLFIWWICASKNNYEQAKEHIRELGLAQDYVTARVPNRSIRKLLAETRHLRPMYEPEIAYANILHLTRDPPTSNNKLEWREKTSSLISPSMGPKLAPESWRRGVLQDRQTSAPLRRVSPWLNISHSDPLMKVDHSLASSVDNSFVSSSSGRDFPPNTPDRPAPLNIRSRGSSTSSNTMWLRSVSTPIRSSPLARSALTPSPVRVNRSSQRPGSLSVQSSDGTTSEHDTALENVFSDDVNNLYKDHVTVAELERDIQAMFQKSGTTRNYNKYTLMTDQVSQTGTSSVSSQDIFSTSKSDDTADTEAYDSHWNEAKKELDHDVFRVLPQSASASRNEATITDTMIRPKVQESAVKGQYTLSIPRSRPLPAIPVSSSTVSQRRAAGQNRGETGSSNPAGVSFNRQLPLRSYESEAFLYPTYRTQALVSPQRSNSTSASPVRGNTAVQIEEVSKMTHRTASVQSASEVPHVLSQASLSPSQGPTPMALSASSSQPNTIADRYKSVTSSYISQLLQKTRARGRRLPSVKTSSLSIDDMAWRNVNEILIVAIYGRHDVELSRLEMGLVDRVSKEIMEGVGAIGGCEWVGELFTPK